MPRAARSASPATSHWPCRRRSRCCRSARNGNRSRVLSWEPPVDQKHPLDTFMQQRPMQGLWQARIAWRHGCICIGRGRPSTVIARLVRAIWYSRDSSNRWIGRGVLGPPPARGTATACTLRLLLHVLDVGEGDAPGTLAGVAEIELVLGHEHRIAVDVVGDAGIVGGDE